MAMLFFKDLNVKLFSGEPIVARTPPKRDNLRTVGKKLQAVNLRSEPPGYYQFHLPNNLSISPDLTRSGNR